MRRALTIILVVGIAVALWWFFKPPNHDEILRRQIVEMVGFLHKNSDENPVFAALQVNKLKEYMAPMVTLEIVGGPPRTTLSREEWIANILMMRGRYNTVSGETNVERVLVFEGEREAVMELTGTARVTRARDTREYTGRYRLRWIRPEKEWLLQASEVIAVSPGYQELDP